MHQDQQVQEIFYFKFIGYPLMFKLLLLPYKAIHGTTAPYLSDLISIHHPLQHFRSNKGITLKQVKTRTSFGDHSFSAAAPKIWNQLPLSLRCEKNIDTFKRHLKTFLFNEEHKQRL
jgi:hypothetical protein